MITRKNFAATKKGLNWPKKPYGRDKYQDVEDGNRENEEKDDNDKSQIM